MAYIVTVTVEFEETASIRQDKPFTQSFEAHSFGEAYGLATETVFEMQHKPFGTILDRCIVTTIRRVNVEFTDVG